MRGNAGERGERKGGTVCLDLITTRRRVKVPKELQYGIRRFVQKIEYHYPADRTYERGKATPFKH